MIRVICRLKFLTIIVLSFFVLSSKGQVYQVMPQYGYKFNRILSDSTLHIPSFCGVPSITDYIKNGMIAIDTCNNVLFQWTRTNGWTPISTGTYLDTTSLSNRINQRVKYTDTASMLNPYLRKVDTVAMLSKYLRKSDTASLSNRINLKLNISDTTSMLNPYRNKVDSIFRTAGKDSIQFRINGRYRAIKDSIGVPPSRTISTTAPLTGGGDLSANRTISIPQATYSSDGYLSSTDFTYFNAKVDPTTGVFTTLPLQGGGNFFTNRTLSIRKANTNDSGYLSAIDYNRFLNKVDTIYRNTTNDSIVFTINNRRNAIPSGTGSGSDTATVIVAKVSNAETTTLLRGEVVYLFGATGNRASVKRAFNLGDSTSSKTFGFVRDSIKAGDTGYVVTQGQIGKLNLSSYTEGQTIYLDSIAGKFTSVKPVAPKHLVVLGIIERANAGNGLLYVKPQNGYELDELHNVSVNGTKNNSVLYYDSTNKLWKATNGPIVTKIIAGTNITLTSPATGTGDVTINASTVGIQAVYGSSPIVVTNPTTTPTIAINVANSSQDGYLTGTDWNTFNGKVSSVSATGLLTSTGGTNPTISSSISANKLVGRNATTSGAFQEITLGSGLSMTGTTLSATGGGGGGSQNLQQVLDTGYTLNGNFYFQTNSFDSVINLSGSLLTASRTYNFPDANGTIALTSDLSTPHYQIDLTSANYNIGGYGIYQIKVGTDSINPFYITFPDATLFVGQRITLVNNDNTYFYNAIIDTSENTPKYQGTNRTIWDIPYGMSYEFVSIDGNWMCTSPTPAYTQILGRDGSDKFATPTLIFGGIYKIYNTSNDYTYYDIKFSDPKLNNGERITLINEDENDNLIIEGYWKPVSKNVINELILKIPPKSTYEFVSIDSQWVCVSMSKLPTYINIDISAANFYIPSCGVYFFTVTSNTYGAILPADANLYDGRQIILINNDATNSLLITNGVNPDGSVYSSLASGGAATFVSINNKWVIIAEK